MNQSPALSFDQYVQIARSMLGALNVDGFEAHLINGLAWSTGIRIKHARSDGREEWWAPAPGYFYPGAANYDAALEAEASGRIEYTAEHVGAIENMVRLSSSDDVAFKACLRLIEKLLEQRTRLPDELNKWLIKFVRGDIKKPRRSGPHKSAQAPRNLRIAQVIHHLVESGMNPTRNDKSNPVSACDAVARAINKSYDAVRTIYDSFPKLRQSISKVGGST